MKIAIKEVGKELQIIETDEKYRTDCCKKYTGENNSVNFVRLDLNGNFCIGVNDCGFPLKLPSNFLLEMASPYSPIQKIVGTAVFVRTKPELPFFDYEIDDLTTEDLALIELILDESYQKELQNNFKDNGSGHVIIEKLS